MSLFLLKLNLQFFSEESHPFAEVSPVAEPHPFAAEPSDSPFAQFSDVPNPLLADYQAPDTPQLLQSQNDQGQVAESSTAEQQVEELDFGGRKVPVVDPIIYDLHKDYSHLNRTFQQKSQELQSAIDLANQWQQYAEQQEQQRQQSVENTPQQNLSAEISAERQQQLNDEYMERMYENKYAADQWWNSQPEIVAQNQERQRLEIESIVSQQLAPFEQEKQQFEAYQQEQEFMQSHPDFEDYRDWMEYIYSENPEIEQLPNALEVLYSMAKVRGSAEPTEPPSFEEMLADPQNQQLILQNEQIRNMVFQNYQQTKIQANKELPTVMGNPVGSQTPMSAGERAPKSLSEATKFWLNSQGQQY